MQLLQHNYNQPKREIATRAYISNLSKEHFTIQMISYKFDCVVIPVPQSIECHFFWRGISAELKSI